LALDNSYADRMEGLFYSKSDEKFTVRALLDDILENRKFNHALDVGPGPGHISEPIARRSRQVTMIELLPEYEEILRKRFDNAKVQIGSIKDIELTPQYDLILFSHVLYYHPDADWLPLTTKLYDALLPGGELILALNSDSGDWWKIVHHYWDRLRPHITFNYIPLSTFKKDLSALGHLHIYPYRYQMWTDPGATWNVFVGKQMLEITDDRVLAENEADFSALSGQFKQIDGSIVLDFRAEIIRIHKD
jgi:SAM-dependent methyltransferase